MSALSSSKKRTDWLLHKQPINALYFEFENELKFYNLGTWSRFCYIVLCAFLCLTINSLREREREREKERERELFYVHSTFALMVASLFGCVYDCIHRGSYMSSHALFN